MGLTLFRDIHGFLCVILVNYLKFLPHVGENKRLFEFSCINILYIRNDGGVHIDKLFGKI